MSSVDCADGENLGLRLGSFSPAHPHLGVQLTACCTNIIIALCAWLHKWLGSREFRGVVGAGGDILGREGLEAGCYLSALVFPLGVACGCVAPIFYAPISASVLLLVKFSITDVIHY
jgi:hypothetical protein